MLKEDLIEGLNVENEVAEFYRNKGFTVTSTVSNGQDSSHDLLLVSPENKTYKIEVKYDRMVNITGNVAIELYKVLNGKKEKSGLSITKSDYYIYKLGTDFYMIKTNKLKELTNKLETNDAISKCMGGDNMSVYIMLIPKYTFKKYCKKLKF